MPRRYRRRSNRRAGRRRGLRKVGRYGLRLRGRITGVHRFKEMYADANLTAGAATSGAGIMKFVFNNLTNAPSFKNLFDLYKLTGVKTTIIPQWNSSEIGTSNASELPILYVAPNRDPYVPAPVSEADILNDDGVRIIRLSKPVSLFLKNPKPSLIAPTTDGLVQSFMPIQFNSSSKALQPWLTTGGNSQAVDQSAIPYFGWRWWLDNVSNTTIPVSVRVYHTLYFSMKEQD